MTLEKFKAEVQTLEKFFTKYCENHHENLYEKSYKLEYKQEEIKSSFCLCDDCHKLISYSFERLQECPHEIKPMCRRCPNPCYEKSKWKKLAKLMRYSGMQFGLIKIKKLFNI